MPLFFDVFLSKLPIMLLLQLSLLLLKFNADWAQVSADKSSEIFSVFDGNSNCWRKVTASKTGFLGSPAIAPWHSLFRPLLPGLFGPEETKSNSFVTSLGQYCAKKTVFHHRKNGILVSEFLLTGIFIQILDLG